MSTDQEIIAWMEQDERPEILWFQARELGVILCQMCGDAFVEGDWGKFDRLDRIADRAAARYERRGKTLLKLRKERSHDLA